jgi:DNA-binding NarL/FixJ family response regulator
MDIQTGTILCVEDDSLLLEYLVMQVEQFTANRFKIVVAADGQTGLRLAREHSPVLVILDLLLPDMHGLAVAAGLSVLQPPPKVLVLTVSATEPTLSRLPYAPIHGFVLKTSSHRADLEFAIQKILAGETYFPTHILARIDLATSQPDHFSKILSIHEIELLPFFGYGWSDEMIATHTGLDSASIAAFQTDLLKKLNLGSDRELMRWAQKHGFSDYAYEPRLPDSYFAAKPAAGRGVAAGKLR